MDYTPHFFRAHPFAKIRLLNQWTANQPGYDFLSLKDAGVFYYVDKIGKENLIDMKWTAKNDFELSFELWTNQGIIVKDRIRAGINKLNNEQILNVPRKIYFLSGKCLQCGNLK